MKEISKTIALEALLDKFAHDERIEDSVRHESTDYEGEKEVWQYYSTLFFNNLIKGQAEQKRHLT